MTIRPKHLKSFAYFTIIGLLTGLTFSIPPALCADSGDVSQPQGTVTVEKVYQFSQPLLKQQGGIQIDQKPIIGLVLGGGGTRGAAHVGVLKELIKAGIPFDCTAGTSIGAIIGGLYDAGVPLSELEAQVKTNAVMKAFMNTPLYLRLATTPIHAIPRLFGYKHLDGLYNGTAFKKFLQKELSDQPVNIENLSKPYCAVALSLIDGHAHAFTSGDLVTAMQASSAVPELRRPVEVTDQLYVDGGVVANLPVEQARNVLGANFIIAVDVDEKFDPVPLKDFKKLGSVGLRLLTLELARTDYPQMINADIVIHPDVNGIGLISRRDTDAMDALHAGEVAARRALPAILAALKERGIEPKSARTAITN